MKKLKTLLLLFLTFPFYGQWVQQNSGVSVRLNDVYCINENFAVVVGNNGTILKTTDSGSNWVQKISGTNYNLAKVQFVNSNVGYIIANMGFNGKLLKTVDGGESWTSISTAGTSFLYDLSCVDENIVFVTNDAGILKKSTNGGNSFEVVDSSEFLQNIQFINNVTAFASDGNALIKTTDSGVTWINIGTVDSFPGHATFYFVNENIGFVQTSNQLFKTINGGASYVYLDTINYTVGKIFAPTENIVWGVSVDLTLNNEPDHTLKGLILDNGTFQRIDGNPYFRSIHFSDELHGFAVDWEGKIYRNTTGTMLRVNDVNYSKGFNVSPNPASNQISISFNEKTMQPFSVKITDTSGKEFYSESFLARNFLEIGTAQFSKGIYFVTVTVNQETQTQKIVIK